MHASTTAAIAAATVAVVSAKTFDATAKTNVVTYWGQGAGQEPLLNYCANPNVDIVNIGFVNVFPDQGKAGWPGTNFGNACGKETYTYNNISTQLLSNCPNIGPDIVLCQQIYGTKILLSIGGAEANGYLVDDESGSDFAKFLWGSFGPSLPEWTNANGPRPFGNATVDGFDFDIESELSRAPTFNGTTITDYKTRGWASMVSTFKNNLFSQDRSKQYYLSAAPQCITPDEHLSTVIASSWFDFIFVQFYNTPQCSARAAVSTSGFTGYANWASAPSFNPNVKVYMGLGASNDSVADASYYLTPSEVKSLVGKVYTNSKFGGIMLWQATSAEENVLCSKDYATWMKQILVAKATGKTINADTKSCPAQPVTPDGTCGGYSGYTCAGSMFGNCCSIYGFCGNSAEYCSGSACDPDGGDCGDEYVGIIDDSNSTSNATASASGNTTMTAISTSSIKSALASGVFSSGVSSGLPLATAAATGKYSNTTSARVNATSSSSRLSSSLVFSQMSSSSTTSMVSSQMSSSSITSSAPGRPTASSVDDSFFCPRLNGQIYVDDNGASFRIQCNTEHSGIEIDLSVQLAKRQTVVAPNNLGDCLALCDEVASCVGTAFNTALSVCTLYSSFGDAAANADVDFGLRVSNTTSAVSTLMTTSTVFNTITQTITTTNAAGEPTVYVTAFLTSYTTVCPVTAAQATATSSVAPATTQAAAVNVKYGPSTKTIYSTQYVTLTSCAPSVTDCPTRPESQTIFTLTSTYAVGTSLVYHAAVGSAAPSSSDEKTSTSTLTLGTTSVIYQTVTVSPFSSQSAVISAAQSSPATQSSVVAVQSSAALVSSTSQSSVVIAQSSDAPASSSVLQSSVVVAQSSEAPASSSVSQSSVEIVQSSTILAVPTNVNFAAPYALSNSSSIVTYPTAGTASSTIVQIITATLQPVQAQVSQGFPVGPVSGVASSTAAYNRTASTTLPALAIFTGAANRAEYGIGAIALAIGAVLAL